MMNEKALCTARELAIGYGKTPLLSDICLGVQPGQILTLIGPNGAGKTTTIKSILRLVRPDGGTVQFLGKPLDMDASALRREAGYVSGDLCYYPRKRLSQLTAVTRSFYSAWDSARYEALLRRFSLDDSKRVCELSEGMKVKYQLALAMSHGAKLLILDEPTSGLDPVSRDDLHDLFLTLAEEDGVSILFSTHITSDLEKCADHITYIQNGRIFASQTKKDFLAAYVLAEGTPEQLTPAMERALIGPRKHRESFAGLLEAKDAALAAGCKVTQPSLEDIMVQLERETEQ